MERSCRRWSAYALAVIVAAGLTPDAPIKELSTDSCRVYTGNCSLIGAGPARAVDNTAAVYLVHGFRTRGTDCRREWASAVGAIRGRDGGWRGPVHTVGFYHNDRRCSVTIGRGDADVRIKELGRLLAWEVHRRDGSAGRTVHLIGHSMGGLIVRAALTGVARAEPDFPPALLVGTAVTLATPHGGTQWAQVCRLTWNQCRDLVPRSGLLRWLADEPQSTGGTAWTLIASADDLQVRPASATGMGARHKYLYRSRQRLGHAAILRAAAGTFAASVWHRDDPGWREHQAVPPPVSVAAAALAGEVVRP
jgi:hypothetical protein